MKVLWLLSIRQRFSCTVNCETEKDRLQEDGVMVMVAAALGTEGEEGACLFAANLQLIKVYFQFRLPST
jgi:hypothetical protein